MASPDLLPEDCLVQILSHVPPRLVCQSSLVSTAIRDAAESELLWETFLPSGYREIICRLVTPIMFKSKKQLYVKLLSPVLIDGAQKVKWSDDIILGFAAIWFVPTIFFGSAVYSFLCFVTLQTFSIDRETNKKCYTLSARELSIAFSRNALCWCWKPLLGSR